MAENDQKIEAPLAPESTPSKLLLDRINRDRIHFESGTADAQNIFVIAEEIAEEDKPLEALKELLSNTKRYEELLSEKTFQQSMNTQLEAAITETKNRVAQQQASEEPEAKGQTPKNAGDPSKNAVDPVEEAKKLLAEHDKAILFYYEQEGIAPEDEEKRALYDEGERLIAQDRDAGILLLPKKEEDGKIVVQSIDANKLIRDTLEQSKSFNSDDQDYDFFIATFETKLDTLSPKEKSAIAEQMLEEAGNIDGLVSAIEQASKDKAIGDKVPEGKRAVDAESVKPTFKPYLLSAGYGLLTGGTVAASIISAPAAAGGVVSALAAAVIIGGGVGLANTAIADVGIRAYKGFVNRLREVKENKMGDEAVEDLPSFEEKLVQAADKLRDELSLDVSLTSEEKAKQDIAKIIAEADELPTNAPLKESYIKRKLSDAKKVLAGGFRQGDLEEADLERHIKELVPRLDLDDEAANQLKIDALEKAGKPLPTGVEKFGEDLQKILNTIDADNAKDVATARCVLPTLAAKVAVQEGLTKSDIAEVAELFAEKAGYDDDKQIELRSALEGAAEKAEQKAAEEGVEIGAKYKVDAEKDMARIVELIDKKLGETIIDPEQANALQERLANAIIENTLDRAISEDDIPEMVARFAEAAELDDVEKAVLQQSIEDTIAEEKARKREEIAAKNAQIREQGEAGIAHILGDTAAGADAVGAIKDDIQQSDSERDGFVQEHFEAWKSGTDSANIFATLDAGFRYYEEDNITDYSRQKELLTKTLDDQGVPKDYLGAAFHELEKLQQKVETSAGQAFKDVEWAQEAIESGVTTAAEALERFAREQENDVQQLLPQSLRDHTEGALAEAWQHAVWRYEQETGIEVASPSFEFGDGIESPPNEILPDEIQAPPEEVEADEALDNPEEAPTKTIEEKTPLWRKWGQKIGLFGGSTELSEPAASESAAPLTDQGEVTFSDYLGEVTFSKEEIETYVAIYDRVYYDEKGYAVDLELDELNDSILDHLRQELPEREWDEDMRISVYSAHRKAVESITPEVNAFLEAYITEHNLARDDEFIGLTLTETLQASDAFPLLRDVDKIHAAQDYVESLGQEQPTQEAEQDVAAETNEFSDSGVQSPENEATPSVIESWVQEVNDTPVEEQLTYYQQNNINVGQNNIFTHISEAFSWKVPSSSVDNYSSHKDKVINALETEGINGDQLLSAFEAIENEQNVLLSHMQESGLRGAVQKGETNLKWAVKSHINDREKRNILPESLIDHTISQLQHQWKEERQMYQDNLDAAKTVEGTEQDGQTQNPFTDVEDADFVDVTSEAQQSDEVTNPDALLLPENTEPEQTTEAIESPGEETPPSTEFDPEKDEVKDTSKGAKGKEEDKNRGK